MPAPKGNDFAVGNDGGPPDGSANAEKHGLTADSWRWFARNREEVENDVKEQVEKWVEAAPFGWDSGNVEILLRRAIKEKQYEQGDEYIEKEGVIVEEKKVAGDGTFITVERENPAFLYQSRIHRTTLRILKDFGILDGPDMKQAEAEGDKAQAWRDALKKIQE